MSLLNLSTYCCRLFGLFAARRHKTKKGFRKYLAPVQTRKPPRKKSAWETDGRSPAVETGDSSGVGYNRVEDKLRHGRVPLSQGEAEWRFVDRIPLTSETARYTFKRCEPINQQNAPLGEVFGAHWVLRPTDSLVRRAYTECRVWSDEPDSSDTVSALSDTRGRRVWRSADRQTLGSRLSALSAAVGIFSDTSRCFVCSLLCFLWL
jgi:hypothetical protein